MTTEQKPLNAEDRGRIHHTIATLKADLADLKMYLSQAHMTVDGLEDVMIDVEDDVRDLRMTLDSIREREGRKQ